MFCSPAGDVGYGKMAGMHRKKEIPEKKQKMLAAESVMGSSMKKHRQ